MLRKEPGSIKSIGYAAGLSLILCACAGLSDSPDEQLLRRAFTAIKNKDLEAYRQLTVTSAAFQLQKDKVSPFKAKLGFVGSVLKPEQEKRRDQEFEVAAAGGEKFIDFKNVEFAGAAKTISDELELIGGEKIPIRVLSCKLKSNGKIFDSNELQPYFMLADWHGNPKILKLVFEKEGEISAKSSEKAK